MSDLDVWGVVSGAMPQGPDRSADPALVVACPVLAVDSATRRVRVTWRGAASWLPAQPGRYRVAASTATVTQGLARVLVSPTTGRPVLVLGPVDPDSAVQTGTVTATTSSPPTVTLTLRGVSHVLPAVVSTYTVGSQAYALTDDWGTPIHVLGPTSVPADPTPEPPPPPPTPTTVQVSTTIAPTWSASWRASRSKWTDEGSVWNAGRYGGSSTLYQGDAFGSGPMKGLATYGDQLVNLGAISIDQVQVAIRNVGLASGSPAVTVQGSPHGSKPSGAPSSSGDTAAGMDAWVTLPASVREAMRTGAVKGLALVGAAYSACAGAGNGDGMVLAVTFTRSA